MPDRPTAEEKLTRLRELILNARAMPMSASCVINRAEVLSAIDEVIDNLPDEISDAQRVIDRSQAKIAEGEAESQRLVAQPAHWVPTAHELHAELSTPHCAGVTVQDGALPFGQLGQASRKRLRGRPPRSRPTPRRRRRRSAGRPTCSSTRGWRASSRCCTRPRARSRPPALGWPTAAVWTPTAAR